MKWNFKLPKPKGRHALEYRGECCLNCGHPLDHSDRYCPNCSQINSTKRLELLDFLHELLSGIINYDSRLVRTLQALLLRPGKISRDYINGMRVRYTNPFRFLLSTAIVYFLLIALTTDLRQFDRISGIMELDEAMPESGPVQLKVNSDEEQASGNPEISGESDQSPEVESEESVAGASGGLGAEQAAEMERELARIPGLNAEKRAEIVQQSEKYQNQGMDEAGRSQIRRQDSLILANPRAYLGNIEQVPGQTNRYLRKMYFFYKTLDADYVDDYPRALEKFKMQDSQENRMSFRSGQSLSRVIAQPSLFAADLLSKLPFLVFLFIPIFTLFVHLVYIRKNYTYTEHLIFSFHNQSLLFILLIVSVAVDELTGLDTIGLALLAFGFYLYKAMRKFYGQDRFKTILKYTFLNTVFGILALASTLLLFFGSLLTY